MLDRNHSAVVAGGERRVAGDTASWPAGRQREALGKGS